MKDEKLPTQITPLAKHTRDKSIIKPPFAKLEKIQFSSWKDDRFPEMLWVALLEAQFPEERVTLILRKLLTAFKRLNARKPDAEKIDDLSLSGLAALATDDFDEIVSALFGDTDVKDALSPLLLFDSLPARERWVKHLTPPDASAWDILCATVAPNLNHQSSEATRCRWVRLMSLLGAGKFKLLIPNAKERYEALVSYPEGDNLSETRPFIRASEIAVGSGKHSPEWAQRFWQQCFDETDCKELGLKYSSGTPSVGTTRERVTRVRESLLKHWHSSVQTTAVNAKIETVFGTAFFCLNIIEELLGLGVSSSITARLALRTMAECYITLAYLLNQDDPALWSSHRVFGSGQAKLSYLKHFEITDPAKYINIDMLRDIANEDVWQEFLNINIGHWSGADLRSLATKAGVKDLYDKYYVWPSSYVHGHWGAIRGSVFDICANPLHRLHRIPTTSARALPDVLSDACSIQDTILELLSGAYPEFSARVTTT